MGNRLDITIRVDGEPINVLEFYQRQGFGRLPATPTMSGLQIKAEARIDPSRGMWLSPAVGHDAEISDNEAVALTDGMEFYTVAAGRF